MSAHLIADDTTTPTATDPAIPGPAADAWLALSAAMTDAIPDIADREDLIVTIAPGAGHGAPACFLPHHAAVEVDGTHLGIDPATARPDDPRDRARYATAWGLLTHEAAHARHSTWTPHRQHRNRQHPTARRHPASRRRTGRDRGRDAAGGDPHRSRADPAPPG